MEGYSFPLQLFHPITWSQFDLQQIMLDNNYHVKVN